MMLRHLLTEPIEVFPAEAVTALQADRVEPEFRFAFVSFRMDMRRFTVIAGIKEEPKWSAAENRGHATMLSWLAV